MFCFGSDDDRDFDSDDDDDGDGDHISGGADADDSDRSDGFGGRKGRLGDGRDADGGGGGADRSYKQHAADRGSSQRISATTKFDVPDGLKGRKRPLLLIASGKLP